MPHIICVGAIYMDTILEVPEFPQENTKLRAKSMKRRRGGNTGNTLEVLSQLLPDDNFNKDTLTYHTKLSLMSVLPDPNSPDTKAVILSLPDVSPQLFLYRTGQQSAASSYIVSPPNGTRTIVSYNPLDDMTFEEFKAAIVPLITADTMKEEVWIHFEGRIPEVVNACVAWLRSTYGYNQKVAISVELEKPDRWILEKSARCADVVFYSKDWAENWFANAYSGPASTPYSGPAIPDAESFLKTQIAHTQPTAFLICTWGKGGAAAVRKFPRGRPIHDKTIGWRPHLDEPQYSVDAVDTVGAGDTFIAGILYACVHQRTWGAAERLEFANELAGRKVHQRGFEGLGAAMRKSAVWEMKLAESALS
ncbi:hypothetical protein B5807_08280 [Epicoccum nigrum]|uniref:Carbohydrate kinase PfkB domain-containing protein n=1 Tax=Epicoccum nigrum TaxID=105696 RepID=A0A1Y2LQ95_EPING|nr:hypothetical protein B5807_08280 [Epicoccum nigrum]